MKLTIESTNEYVQIDDRLMRIWRGHTAGGIPVEVYGVLLGVDFKPGVDYGEIEREFGDGQLADWPPPGSRPD